MSVEVIATRRPISRRSGGLPCRASADATARVGGRSFTADCRDHEDAIEAARTINAARARHFKELT